MKIYLFDPETGVFQGEDFADHAPPAPERPEIRPDATTIAPPRFGHGEIPVFNLAGNKWEIRHVSAVAAGGGASAAAGGPAVGEPASAATAQEEE